MAIDLSDQLARTIEFQTALIHLDGEYAGAIEIPIYVGRPHLLHDDLDELYLRVSGEQQLLQPARREFFCGRLRLTYFSEYIRNTRRLPRSLQLHWGDPEQEETCGMELTFNAAPNESA